MSLSKEYSDCIIVGDFNHPHITWTPAVNSNYFLPSSKFHRRDHPDNLFIECMRDSFLYQLVDEPTRYRLKLHGKEKRIQQPTIDDLILTSNPVLIENINYNMHLGGSDHLCLAFTADLDYES